MLLAEMPFYVLCLNAKINNNNNSGDSTWILQRMNVQTIGRNIYSQHIHYTKFDNIYSHKLKHFLKLFLFSFSLFL